MLQGKWLWFGATRYSSQEWEALCQQAASWGLDGVHPKVADGQNVWYDYAGLQMLKNTAERHHLAIVPYHYCYGPRFGSVQITREAELQAMLGTLFGAIIPDIEDEYMAQYGCATSFAQQVRSRYHGLWLPTLYPNPVTHAVPLLQLNPYMDAWLPQVYFSVWQPQTASNAISYVVPQWYTLDAEAKANGQGGLKPILPIISLGNNLSPEQIVNFAQQMHGYGYLGLWYQGEYAPYAETIRGIGGYTPAPLPVSVKPAAGQEKNPHMEKQFEEIWNLNTLHADSTTGIAQAVKAAFHAGHLSACYPLTGEITTCDWNGNEIRWQSFSNGVHAEYNVATHIVRLYDAHSKEILP